MEKVAIEKIKASKRKDKENRQVIWVEKLGSTIEQTTQKIVEKHDFQVGLWVDSCEYMGWIWSTQHGCNNKQRCRHGLNNNHEGVEQQGYYLPMIKK